MARSVSRKQLLKQDEAVAEQTRDWLEEHWRTLLMGVGALLVVAAIVALWAWSARRNVGAAAEALADGTLAYRTAEESGFEDRAALDNALARFEDAIDLAPGSPSGRSATYYKAVALYRLGRGEEAIPLLDALASQGSEPTLTGSAGLMLAQVLVDTGKPDRAIELLDAMASKQDAGYPRELALLELGKVYQRAGRDEEARSTWDRVSEEFPSSVAAQEAARLRNR